MKGNLTFFSCTFSNTTQNKMCIKQPKNRVKFFIGGYTGMATIGFKISIHQNKDKPRPTPLIIDWEGFCINGLTEIKTYVMI